MGLWVEHDFGMSHAVAVGALQIGHGHVVEVVFGDQHAGARIVQIKERLQIFELIGRAQGLDRGKGQRNAIALRSEEHTSELQSLMRISYAVFCLKKKKNN